MPDRLNRQIKQSKFDEILSFGCARHAIRYPLRADVRLIRRDGEISAAVMVDVSVSGLGMDALLNFARNTRVEVAFPNGIVCSGRMVWRDAFSSGLLFDEQLSLFQLEKLKHDLAAFSLKGKAGHGV